MPNRPGRLLGVAALTLVLAACAGAASPSGASTASGSGAPAIDDAAARQFCTDKGGQLVDRIATWNTNADTPSQLPLAGRLTFCEFQSGSGNETTRISVDLTTLSSERPTIAAVAHLSKIGPLVPDTPSENPRSTTATRAWADPRPSATPPPEVAGSMRASPSSR
jgi:hypothetical protein